MGDEFQEFLDRGCLLSEEQQARFVELLKKKSVLMPESRVRCMKCGNEQGEDEQVQNPETGEMEWPPCGCGLPEPDLKTLRFRCGLPE